MIFNKLLKGLEQAENSNLEHLIGSTYHNMGIIYTCMGKFQEALHAFQKAVDARIAFYAQSHPLVAVSFALLLFFSFYKCIVCSYSYLD